ncbi:BQ5605_C004g02939 [Microbotryum silenes-dioicae]|uniref:BQ5605_C004g02939 protein n=1 Tax=Microbotryum silenes-dioicae TaxID=796604 RepID=A0A2X0MCK1_9BASI|nr:BQ5605_C004g02939 [Microbotryum silenes-dioicae]
MLPVALVNEHWQLRRAERSLSSWPPSCRSPRETSNRDQTAKLYESSITVIALLAKELPAIPQHIVYQVLAAYVYSKASRGNLSVVGVRITPNGELPSSTLTRFPYDAEADD